MNKEIKLAPRNGGASKDQNTTRELREAPFLSPSAWNSKMPNGSTDTFDGYTFQTVERQHQLYGGWFKQRSFCWPKAAAFVFTPVALLVKIGSFMCSGGIELARIAICPM